MEAQPWHRQPGEPLRWFRRFEQFRLMIPVRSVNAVFREEDSQKQPATARKTPRDTGVRLQENGSGKIGQRHGISTRPRSWSGRSQQKKRKSSEKSMRCGISVSKNSTAL